MQKCTHIEYTYRDRGERGENGAQMKTVWAGSRIQTPDGRRAESPSHFLAFQPIPNLGVHINITIRNGVDQTLRNKFLEIIKSVQPAGRWKLVVVDSFSLKILNSACKMYDILEENLWRISKSKDSLIQVSRPSIS
ncbi:hypothetical protein BX666DRAFT_1350800 [Dichotomocladium elegans]|nr:hypothetical protein BX666DRAFT_1350800 [Dichotomocladium elegans]